jgi:hypothetical protein
VTKQSGLNDRLLVGGNNLSGDTQQLNRIGGGPAALVVTGIDKSAYERLGGLRDGGIDWTSYFNKAAGAAHPVLSALPRTDVIVTYLRDTIIGNPAASMVSKQISYDGQRANDGMFTFNLACVANMYGLEWGEQLTAGVRTDTSATNGTGFDFGSTSTLFGGQAYLHVTGFTGTSVTVTLQDSADNVSFANITGAAFTAATAIGAQRIAFTGTVRRYVRAITSGTFSSASFSVNFVRNLTAVTF